MAYQPQFKVTPHLIEIIEEIAAFREKILASSVQVTWIPALQKDARVRSAHSSTAIEGNPLTLEQVRLLEEGKPLSSETQRSQQEILNYFAGLRFIEKNISIKEIKHQDIFKLHTLVASQVMDQGETGSYRKIEVRVGQHIPPPSKNVFSLMDEFLKWWNKESSRWSPVITSAIIHYRFEEIHPFADGNGRTGRLLALWELYRRGFDTHHIFSVDEVFWENRPHYYAMLENTQQQKGDLSGWLEYVAEAIHLTLEKVWLRVKQLSVERGNKKIILRPKQEKLVQLLRDSNGLTPKEIRESLKVSKQGAMDLINPLLRVGLIERMGTKKSGRYVLK